MEVASSNLAESTKNGSLKNKGIKCGTDALTARTKFKFVELRREKKGSSLVITAVLEGMK